MSVYHAFSVTHKGGKHAPDEPCQDASGQNDILGNARIIAVADGHGSSRCFRSDIGSSKAIEATMNAVAYFVKNTVETDIVPEVFKDELQGVAKQIINQWFAAIMKHEEENPLQNDPNLKRVAQKYKDRYLLKDLAYGRDYRTHAYGATLIAAVMDENYWFAFQVGDGKCVVLYEDGSWRLPIPWDNNCSFNTTTSICDDDSLSEFRYWFGIGNDEGGYDEYGFGVDGQGRDYNPNPKKSSARPLAIFIGSDGVEDSYPTVENDKYIVNFYRNRILTLAEDGLESFKAEIDEFAKHFADHESKDDVSIAMIVGDFVDKSAVVQKMKRESKLHEAVERAAAKRRDADEKKAALDTVQKRTDAVTANQRQLENEIASVESEWSALSAKKELLEYSLAKSKADIAASDREMDGLQSRLRELESEKTKREQEERTAGARVVIADDEVEEAKKAFGAAAKNLAKLQNALCKKKEDYNKRSQKLSATKPLPLTGPAPAAASASAVKNNVIVDAKLQSLKQEIGKLSAELQAAQAQVDAARQNLDAKSRELGTLRQRLLEAQQRIRQAESEISRVAQDCRAVEVSSKNHREAARKLQSDIEVIELEMRAKQSDLARLAVKLETQKEQTQKQTDTLSQIRAAWEKAEAEARALEATVNDVIQEGEV